MFFVVWILWLAVYVCPVVSTRWSHNVAISMHGHDNPECLENISTPCSSLDYVLNAVINKNSTALFIEPGFYHLNSSYAFWHIKQFAIIGSSLHSQDVMVHCSSLSGLSFIYSEDIMIKNITLSSCGALQNSTSNYHPQFLTSLFLVNCIHLTMDGVLVTNAPGIGMQLYDVSGTVRISKCHFLRNGNGLIENPMDKPLKYVTSGGGIYLEYTFKGGLWPFNARPNEIYQQNASIYLLNLSFEENVAPDLHLNNSFVFPNASDHMAFGRGGGVSFFFKGRARNNKVLFDACQFNQNHALWGGGFFIEYQDQTQDNHVTFSSSRFYQNRAKYGGGGVRVGLITMIKSPKSVPNVIDFKSCHFKMNKAILGGGVALYGTTKPSYSTYFDRSFVNFTSCVVEENYATVGSAIGSALWNTNDYGIGIGNPLKVLMKNCNITKNSIIFTEDNKVEGIGALYSQGTPIILHDTEFTLNYGSALVLDNVIVQIDGNVLFKNNTGTNGGAVALYGRSKLRISKKAHLIFVNNTCSVHGGAIFVRTPGPLLVSFKTTELNLHGCFISSDQGGFDPDTWDFDVSFFGNKGPSDSSGYSVFATTLQFCRKPGENRINNTALQWKSFHYYLANGSKSNMLCEIVTDAVEMEVNKPEWNVTADKTFSPTLRLFDEKYNSVYGLVSIHFKPKGKVVLDPPSTYFVVKDRIQSLLIQGKPYTHYDVKLSTVNSQLVVRDISNVEIKTCSAGFVSVNYTCKCNMDDIGVSRCDDKNKFLFLLKGYWGGYVQSNKKIFVTVPCPENYCVCLGNNTISSDGECFFNIFHRCDGNRKGQLCGECKSNFSLKVGDDNCVDDCNHESSWVGYLIGLLLFLTLLVLVIMFINFDPFSAYLNAWLYSYQVILFLLPRRITLDPFLLFIVGLANVRISGVGGVCMWSAMDDLQKLAFNYIFPVYVFCCLYVLHLVALTFRNNFFTRRLTQTSTARAFCTLFVLSYSTVTSVSLSILYPVKIGDKYFLFYQGTEEYFGSYHIGFAVVAIILLITVGILFPLVLLCRQWFSFIDKGLIKLLLDNFQTCFRVGFKWCAGFYFVGRFVILVIATFVPPGALKVSLLQSVCCVILTVFVLCRPYEDSDRLISYQLLNTSDAVLLCNLCILNSFGGALSGIFATDSYYNAFEIVIYILAYVPFLFSVGLLAYFLRLRYVSAHVLLNNLG